MAEQFQAVMDTLGGVQAFGRRLETEGDLREAVRRGFPPAVMKELLRASGLNLTELAAALDLSSRSLQRRRETGRLAPYESDRLYRLARTLALARETLGDSEKARLWLRRPNRALGGATPVDSLDTELGARQVESVLGRIAFGGIS